MPNSIQSMEAIANGQTRLNGGARRPRYDWVDAGDNPVGPTRLAHEKEAGAVASVPDEVKK